MDSVNEWVGLLLGVVGVLTGVGAMLRWTSASMLRTLDARIEATLESKLESKLGSMFDAKLAPILHRLDALEARVAALETRADRLEAKVVALDVKVGHIAEVLDLRLRPVESDMRLVKQHLLGTPAT